MAIDANPTAAFTETCSIPSRTKADKRVATGMRKFGVPVCNHSFPNEMVPVSSMIPVDLATASLRMVLDMVCEYFVGRDYRVFQFREFWF